MHPEDNGQVLAALSDIRQYEDAQGYARAEGELLPVVEELRQDYAELLTKYNTHMETHEPALLSSAAVRVFPRREDLVYREHAKVLELLGELGIKRMSHQLLPDLDQKVIDFTVAAYERFGIKSWFSVGQPRVVYGDAEWDKMLELVTGPFKGMVTLCSGWNEPNHRRNQNDPPLTNWEANTAHFSWQMKEHFGNLNFRLGSPQLWSGNFDDHDADLAALKTHLIRNGEVPFDRSSIHLYPRGGVGQATYLRFKENYNATFGELPIVCTEGGWLTAPNYTGGAKVVTEEQAAAYLPEWIRMYVGDGGGASVFELLDEPDSTGADREKWLGLVATPSKDPATWRPKPAFYAYRDLLASAA